MPKTKKKKYLLERTATIILTTLMLPFGTYVGFQFGAGHTKTALIALGIQTGITFIQATLWWYTIEKIRSQ